VGERELRALIAANPDDDATYAVYADELLTRGEPRGELIAIDAALERAPIGARAVLRRRRAELLAEHPTLAPPSHHGVTLRWRLGFVRTVLVEAKLDLAQVFAHDALAFTTTLVLGRNVDLAPATGLRLPVTLRSLSFYMDGWVHDRAPIDVDAIVAEHPGVTRLAATWPVTLTAATQLRALELRGLPPEGIATIARASLPALEALVLQLASTWSLTPAAVATEDLAPLLEHPPPWLAHLEIVDPPPGDELIARIATSPLLRQLRTLTLWNAGLSVAGARVVTRESFGHLERLDLTDVGLDAETEGLLDRCCREVVGVPPRLRVVMSHVRNEPLDPGTSRGGTA
jgi:uncharacterized protein (TIGR02996 family)